ncbi:MAG TPA: PAS domain S-box protein [Terriglobales bacterium]|nr:PAS domain S-box protein [Terriglobales bacterium]
MSRAAFQSTDASRVIESFCRLARDFFHASGVYFWQCSPEGGLVGGEADGYESEGFRGLRLQPGDSSVALEAVQCRRTTFVNDIDMTRSPRLADYRANAVLAAPLLVSGEVVGAVAILRDSPGSLFDDDSAAKATILAAQLGTALEALRLNLVSQEEHRRATILAELATVLHGLPDTAAVLEAIADRLRVLLRSPAVLVFVHEEGSFRLHAVSADSPGMAHAIRSRDRENNLRSPVDVANRAVAAGERVTVSIGGGAHLGGDSPGGALIASPFRTSRSHGAILVYPRANAPFTDEEQSLVSALSGFGAVAIANAELYGMARAQAQELHQILEISMELGSAGKLEQFLQTFVTRATSFLGFRRSVIGLAEGEGFRLRWGVDNGRTQPIEASLPLSVGTRALLRKQVFHTEDASSVPGANMELVNNFKIRQILLVPLLGSNGEVLGMFGMLERASGGNITEEDIRRAQALAAQAAIALELTANLHRSEQHRKRAEALVSLALELNTVLHLPQFARSFANRAADLLGGSAVALSLFLGATQETVLMQGGSEVADKALLRRFNLALGAALSSHEGDVVFRPAGDLLGSALASSLGWTDCTMVRLAGSSGEVIGVLCLADRKVAPAAEDQQLLRAVASHASVALENACLFTRMEQSNRHWVEVFDAISDFIVVHDEAHNILRVNRSLADFVGIAPEQLIGLNMRALQALPMGSSPHACPFCRTSDSLGEYVQNILERTYLISTSRIHAAASAQLQTVHVLKDITDRRDAEQRYRELFDNIQEGLYFSTPQGRFVEVNDALVRILGYSSREELLQVDIPSALFFFPERRKELAAALDADGRMRNHEEILRKKDGSPVHVLINCVAVRDGEGVVQQYRGLLLDVSGLKNSQIELQRERDFSSKILSHTQSLILVTDTTGVISYANRRWAGLGFDQGHLLGHALPEFTSPARQDALREALASVARGQQVDNFEMQLLRGDGQSGQFSVNLSPISGDDGRVSSIVVVMTDVTDSAMLQSKLIHTEKMAAVGQLVSGVAHEVNNPLTAILGFADLLVERTDLPESARRDLRVILQEAQRTKQIVQNLLSFARQMPAQRQHVQLNAILRRTLQLRAYDFLSHGVEIVEQLDQSLPEVIGDAQQLQQVFLNILNNAHDAVRETGRPPRIEIASARRGSQVEVSFRDNGPGIANPDRIFDPFYTTKEVGKGTGLGLSICYGIVREHGGEIVCHNNLDSEGATFVVRLSAAPEAASFGAVAGVQPQ